MSVLKAYFDSSIDQCSSVVKDFVRVQSFDELDNEYITYEEFDYPTFQKSLGVVEDWSLDALIKAGIDPSFSIHTGLSTRLEGVDMINDATAAFDKVFAKDTIKNED